MRQVVVALALLAGTAVSAQAPAESTPDFKARLYRAVFAAGPDTLTDGDLPGLPEPIRARLGAFLARRAAFESQYESRPDSADAVARDAKRREIERAIVALIDTPDIAARAVRFASEVPVSPDWGERAGGPLAEAAYAEDELKKAPDGVLAPFLYLFIAQRQRAAFEAAERAGDTGTMKAAAKKYRLFIGRAREAADPIYALIAADLDGVSHVNLKSVAHPRDFNPDT